MRKLMQQLSRFAALLLFFAAFSLASLPTDISAQQTTETWMDISRTPSLSAGNVLNEREYSELFESRQGVFNDMKCRERSVNFAPLDHPSAGMPYDGCWFSTSIGLLEEDGHGFRPTGWEVAGYVNSFNSQLFPTKHLEHFIEYDTDQSITVRRSDRFIDEAQVTPADTGWDFPVFLDWVYPNSGFKLVHPDGTPWTLESSALNNKMWYSDNGKYLAIWSDEGYLVLLSLETLTIKTIGTGHVGYASLAISDNGRYIAVNSFNDPGLQLIDAWSCGQTDPIHVTAPVTCPSRTISEELIDFGAPNSYGLLPVFHGNDLLSYYMQHDSNEYREYILRAPNTKPGTNYIALGDSYTSGEGAGHYIDGTDSVFNRCHLSWHSYPFQLDLHLPLDSTHSVACSGATTYNIIGGHSNDAAQYSNRHPIHEESQWLPGYGWQLDFIKDEHNPVNVVSVGIGGNDIEFASRIQKCVLYPNDCFQSDQEKLDLAYEISEKFDRFVTVFKALRSAALSKSSDARVYIVGYPSIVSSWGDKCRPNVRLSDKERKLANDVVYHLNTVLSAASRRAGVEFVDIFSALFGHRLCEDTSTPAMHGATLPEKNSSYHPTAFGQQLIYKRIRAVTNSFSRSLPFPDNTVGQPNPRLSLLTSGINESLERSVKLLFGRTIGIEVVLRHLEVASFVLKSEYELKPRTQYELFLASEPVHLGTYETNETGELSVEFKIPEHVEPGLHTLHVRGVNTQNEEIDVYKTIYVAVTNEDWDGDGIANHQEPCGVFEPSSTDLDADGVDDACDTFAESFTEGNNPVKTSGSGTKSSGYDLEKEPPGEKDNLIALLGVDSRSDPPGAQNENGYSERMVVQEISERVSPVLPLLMVLVILTAILSFKAILNHRT